ncbi:MAG: branched-chain amino acid transaminase [Candidatus Aenigmarchaeota archaeon]|nr:branched-chain amino acid transaminase [Candidatus Aenigmarchaeota archaeon]
MEISKKIWFNNKFLNWGDAKIHILTHTLHYGGGVFEGIRTYNTKKGPAVFRLSEHINRFFYSASCLEMDLPFTKEEIKNRVLELIKINNLNECYIRPIAYFGYENMGLNPKGCLVDMAIAAWPWGAYLGGKETVKVKISKYMRLHPKSVVPDAKICGYYASSILASLDAKKSKFDEALFLDFEGNIAEGPGENIFMVKDGKLFTPNSDSILKGLTRDTVIKIAKDLNIKVEEKTITVDELKSADEIFFTGTAVEIQPIGIIDETIINNEKTGKISEKIKSLYQKIIHGEEEKYLKYLYFT